MFFQTICETIRKLLNFFWRLPIRRDDWEGWLPYLRIRLFVQNITPWYEGYFLMFFRWKINGDQSLHAHYDIPHRFEWKIVFQKLIWDPAWKTCTHALELKKQMTYKTGDSVCISLVNFLFFVSQKTFIFRIRSQNKNLELLPRFPFFYTGKKCQCGCDSCKKDFPFNRNCLFTVGFKRIFNSFSIQTLKKKLYPSYVFRRKPFVFLLKGVNRSIAC